MSKMVGNQFRQHFYVIFGVLLGICFGPLIIPMLEDGCFPADFLYKSSYDKEDLMSEEYVPKINLAAKPLKAQRNPQKLLRPRYFSTELGIRKKLFVAVLTTQQSINTRGIVVNKTTSHLVDKLTFFIDAPGNQKLNVSYLKLPGIVGFIDTRIILKPFHVLKYITDNFIDYYDFFFIVNDSAYIKARKLYEMVNKISISQDVYASANVKNSVFCSLNAGILFSNSVIRSMMNNIDWCIKNVFSSSDDDNFGRCVLYSSKIPCQQEIQGSRISSYILQNEQNLNNVLDSNEMNEALTVTPLKNVESYYLLHAYFASMELKKTNKNILALRKSIVEMAPFTPNGINSVTWPVGNQPPSKPATRFDVPRWDYFTETHIYLSDEFSTFRRLNEAEKEDIKVVINTAVDTIKNKYNTYSYYSLANGYRKFDASRGMDYILDIVFRDDTNNEIILKRLEVCKPLGTVEMLSVPYVTENRRVNILLPVRVREKESAIKFLQEYKTECLEKKEKVFLMLVLIYDYDAPGKGTKDDVFQELKNQALALTKMYQRDDNRVAWLSIKLPFSDNQGLREALLNFAVVDLSLKKFPVDSLMLLGRSNMDIRIEFLNRVRMNTILGWQIFSPVPFSEFNPLIHNMQQSYIDVNKRYGRFDSYNDEYLSFYAKDYLVVRRKIETLIPFVKSDSDIRLFKGEGKDFESLAAHTLYGMFVRYGDLHVIRGVEPALRLKYREIDCTPFDNSTDAAVSLLRQKCLKKRNACLGSRSQLAKLLLDYQQASRTNLTV